MTKNILVVCDNQRQYRKYVSNWAISEIKYHRFLVREGLERLSEVVYDDIKYLNTLKIEEYKEAFIESRRIQ